MNNPNDMQIGGMHYASNYQHWDFAAKYFGPGYFKGQVTKYVARWRKKNGAEDLQKARHFLVKMLDIDWTGLGWQLHQPTPISAVEHLVVSNQLSIWERDIIDLVSRSPDKRGMQPALAMLDLMIEDAQKREGEPGPSYTNQDRL